MDRDAHKTGGLSNSICGQKSRLGAGALYPGIFSSNRQPAARKGIPAGKECERGKKMQQNILIGQSGGPTVAINASLAGIARAAAHNGGVHRIYGMRYGIEGLMKGNILDLGRSLSGEEDYHALECTPSMALGSCRFKLPDYGQESDMYYQILSVLRSYQIGSLFYIGGNDSMDTVQKLSAFFSGIGEDIRVVGIPKTIDNDLAETDHSPGFGSAAKFIATAVAEIGRDAAVYDTPSVTIVEIMGRDAGWLTASSALARGHSGGAPHLIYLPESPFDPEGFLEDIRRCHTQVKNVVVAVSEGLRNREGGYAAEAYQTASVDVFGHKSSLAGVGKWLEGLVKEHIGCKVRSIELSVLQRAAAHLLSATDLKEAGEVGAKGLEMALAGQTGVVSVIRRMGNHPYTVSYESAPVERIANREHKVPREWISSQGNNVTEEMLEYLRPLILGEVERPMKDGLPVYFYFPDRG